MTVEKAREELENVASYFKGYTLEIIDKKRGDMFAPRLLTSLGEIKTMSFLTKHNNLMSAAISNHRTISLEEGRRKGIKEGKDIRSDEIKYLLNIKEEEN